MRRLGPPLLLGAAGLAVLISLGLWQLQRMEWKRGILAEIESRIAADPVPLPADPDPERDRYLPVGEGGEMSADEIHVLVSGLGGGPGFRVIAAYETGSGRRILVDRGFVAEADKNAARETGLMPVRGNLLWPQEADDWTPAPDLDANIWFARDVDAMAAALGTEPVLLVATEPTDPEIAPAPVSSRAIPNDHREYAITWFALAVVWAGMTALWARQRLREAPASGK